MSADVLWLAAGCLALVELVLRGAISKGVWLGLARLLAAVESLAMRVVRLVRPPRFVLRGGCYYCGSCCRQIVARPPRLLRRTALINAFLLFHKLVHNFEVVGRGPNDEVVLRCGHLRRDGRCGIYARRPLLCRDYPVQPYFSAPQVLPGCGFAVTPRVVARMRRRDSLPLISPGVTVHHPTRDHGGEDRPEDFAWIDDN